MRALPTRTHDALLHRAPCCVSAARVRPLRQRVLVKSSDSADNFRGSMPQKLWHVVHDFGPQPKAESHTAESALDTTNQLNRDLARLQAYRAYEHEIAKPANKVCLLTCAALIAKASKYPLLEVSEVTAQIDQLAEEVKKQLPKESRYPMKTLKTIIQVLYAQKGLRGNTIDYYDDDNSYVNMVLRNKAGIPITLSLIFMEVAKRVGMPMKGVNLPAHFMLGVEGLAVLVDAYAGEVVLVEDAAAKLSSLMGAEVRLDEQHVLGGKGVAPRQFLMRMLNNLKQIYLITSQPDMALRIIRLMRVTQPSGAELRDEGLCLYSMARYHEAAELLGEYIKVYPRADDALMAFTVLEGCRALLREERATAKQQQEESKQGEGRQSGGQGEEGQEG